MLSCVWVKIFPIYIYIYVRVSEKHEFKGKLLCSKLVRNISSNIFYFLADKADWAVAGCGTYKSKCGCLIWITYGLSYTCIIFKKIKLNTFIFFWKNSVSSFVWMKLTLTRRGCSPKMIVLLSNANHIHLYVIMHSVMVLGHFKLYKLKWI